MNNFPHILKELRKRKSLRQKDLAENLGLGQTTIANYERGIRFPDPKVLENIADYFQVSVDFLLGREENHNKVESESNRENFQLESSRKEEYLYNLRNKYIELILNRKKGEAYERILEAISKGISIKDIYMYVFEKALKEIGTLWEIGHIDVHDEHHFTNSTERFMSQLWKSKSAYDKNRYTVVSLAVGGELHNIGIRMVSDFLEMEGWNAYFIGVNVPTKSVLNAIRDTNADLLALSVTMSMNLDALINLIKAVKSNFDHIKIIVGGVPFNINKELWKDVGADGYCSNAREVAGLIEKLIYI